LDLSLTAEETAFRDEVRHWLEANHPGQGPDDTDADFEFRRQWQHKMHDGGWAGVAWPKEYGGRGASLIEQAIFSEEMARAKAPAPANIIGLHMGGPVVIHHGTEAQKTRYLAPILSADEIWCQGFSEPNAGSDLAALQSRAVRKDGGWVVNGQKVWTSFAHRAKWMMLLARTQSDGEKHTGLTYFLLDMEQDGVEARPLRQITGEAEFNEVFFHDAYIPDENIVGDVGSGWTVAITTLMHERAGLGASAVLQIQMALDELVELIRERGLDEDPLLRQRIAQLRIETETMRLNAYRGLAKIIKNGVPGPEGSLVKWQWAEINQSLTEMAMDVRGADAPLADSEWTYRFLRARANSIEGGTTEILRNILAERVLGLPKLR
jgi:alkylation response protein AidB-like acyl-CoA dehydrogenase